MMIISPLRSTGKVCCLLLTIFSRWLIFKDCDEVWKLTNMWWSYPLWSTEIQSVWYLRDWLLSIFPKWLIVVDCWCLEFDRQVVFCNQEKILHCIKIQDPTVLQEDVPARDHHLVDQLWSDSPTAFCATRLDQPLHFPLPHNTFIEMPMRTLVNTHAEIQWRPVMPTL